MWAPRRRDLWRSDGPQAFGERIPKLVPGDLAAKDTQAIERKLDVGAHQVASACERSSVSGSRDYGFRKRAKRA